MKKTGKNARDSRLLRAPAISAVRLDRTNSEPRTLRGEKHQKKGGIFVHMSLRLYCSSVMFFFFSIKKIHQFPTISFYVFYTRRHFFYTSLLFFFCFLLNPRVSPFLVLSFIRPLTLFLFFFSSPPLSLTDVLTHAFFPVTRRFSPFALVIHIVTHLC